MKTSTHFPRCLFAGFGKNSSAPLDYAKPWREEDHAALPFRAGVNISGLEGEWCFDHAMRVLLQPKTYTNLREHGFDSMRIAIDFRKFYDAETKSLIEKMMAKLDKVLDLAAHAGMYVTLDFHGWYKIRPHDPGDRELFMTIWRLVAERYADRPEQLSFELMNEPHIYGDKINDFQNEAIAVIRRSNPTRLIICAAPDGNQPWQLSTLKLPEDDKHLAVAVHIYHPADFTHQGFDWTDPPRQPGKQVRLSDEMMTELLWNIEETQKFIDTTGIPVVLNEFGLNYNLADPADTDLYLRTLLGFCAKNSLPWAAWNYDLGEMGLYRGGKWRTALLDAIFLR